MTYEDKTNQDFIDLEREVGDVLRGLDKVTAYGLLVGFCAAIKVAERHKEDKGSGWLSRPAYSHLTHALTHCQSAWRDTAVDVIDDDGLGQIDHAACRLLFAIARRDG